MRFYSLICSIFWIIILVATVNALEAKDVESSLSPDSLLSKYRLWLRSVDQTEADFSFTTKLDVKSKNLHIKEEESGNWAFDSRSQCLRFFSESRNQDGKSARKTEIIKIKDKPEIAAAYEVRPDSHTEVEKYSITSAIKEQKNTYSSILSSLLGPSGFVFGYFTYGESKVIQKKIDDALSKMNLSAKTKKANDQIFHVLEAKDGSDTYELWLAPHMGFAPAKIVFTKSTNTGNTKISSGVYNVIFETKEFLKTDNVYIPEVFEINMTSDYLYYDGDKLKSSPSTTTINGTLKNIAIQKALSPSDCKFSMSIPNGVSVTMEDATHLSYVWMNGQIEPLTDELALRIARGGYRFVPSAREPRFWIMAIGLFFIVLGISLKVKTAAKQWRENQ